MWKPARLPPTTTLLSRLDPRQPSEIRVYEVARSLLACFEGDADRASLWVSGAAASFERARDRRRTLTAVRLARALKALAREAPSG